jgi:adenylate kinase
LQSIATTLGNGKTKRFAKEQALLTTILSESDQALLGMSLPISQGIIKDFTFTWKYPTGIVENVQALVSEYQTARRLFPTKILIHGPPASGKTTVAHLIGDEYEIPVISVETALAEELAKIVTSPSCSRCEVLTCCSGG